MQSKVVDNDAIYGDFIHGLRRYFGAFYDPETLSAIGEDVEFVLVADGLGRAGAGLVNWRLVRHPRVLRDIDWGGYGCQYIIEGSDILPLCEELSPGAHEDQSFSVSAFIADCF